MRANPHMSDQTRATRIGRMLPAVCMLAILISALFAAWRVTKPTMEAPSITVAAAGAAEPGVAPLDTSVFRTPLWVAPPAPPPGPVAAAPPPPLRLQLVAILRDKGEYRAALYDPDADKLVVVGPGDIIAGRTIERVGAADLSLRDNGLSRTLSLRTDGGAS